MRKAEIVKEMSDRTGMERKDVLNIMGDNCTKSMFFMRFGTIIRYLSLSSILTSSSIVRKCDIASLMFVEV